MPTGRFYTNAPQCQKNVLPDMSAQWRLRSGCCIHVVWSECSLDAFWIRTTVKFLPAHNADSDQTTQMPMLIWVFKLCVSLRWGSNYTPPKHFLDLLSLLYTMRSWVLKEIAEPELLACELYVDCKTKKYLRVDFHKLKMYIIKHNGWAKNEIGPYACTPLKSEHGLFVRLQTELFDTVEHSGKKALIRSAHMRRPSLFAYCLNVLFLHW